MRIPFILSLALLWAIGASAAQNVEVAPDMVVELERLPTGWVVSEVVPEFLLEENTEHLEHELEAQGKTATAEQIRRVAAGRLAANEAFVYNPQSGAALTIDFSPLREDERAPGRRSIASSARLAAESLEQEEGVSGYTSAVSRFDLSGALNAYRIDASYRLHGETKKFIGIISFVRPYWVFLYYTDPLRDPGDLEEMNRMLEAMAIVPRGE